MIANDTPHRIRQKSQPQLPDGQVTEDVLVRDFYKSHEWRRMRPYLRWWELDMVVRMYVGGYPAFVDHGALEFEKCAQRVLHELRSRNSRKGVPKRLRTLARKRREAMEPKFL